jgi:hypothetical protein
VEALGDAILVPIIIVGSVVVILVALYVLARSIAEGEGAVVGFKKMWSTIWKNMP